MNSKQKLVNSISSIIGKVGSWFLSSLFIWWGWNIFAWHFNLPQFGYMEVFAMRMALASITVVLWQKTLNNGKETII